ncbi:hypothetical protein BH23PLA1_BH23PLA1_38090 [soil metagenome]
MSASSSDRVWRSGRILVPALAVWLFTSAAAEAQVIYRGVGSSVPYSGVRTGLRYMPSGYQAGLAARGLGGAYGAPYGVGFAPGYGLGYGGLYGGSGFGLGGARYYSTSYSGLGLGIGPGFGGNYGGFYGAPGLGYGLGNFYGSRGHFYGTSYYRAPGFGAYGYPVFGAVPGPYSYGFGYGGYYGPY